ncbi:MAG: SDR family NAD(P)-dependent oxidoreductase [Anaerolineales bacterium]|nr:SDR family NAD(P)-dependent oxidoreductase [Anaerolineales bacterium]MCX7756169.1 SDR family NAD(P)-dependent oxidoreductase [Anaerolineales bacterium]MDW8277208.1 SDR family NAD(P)-dependent oxidoreductase [Anaerolineales bacterium]
MKATVLVTGGDRGLGLGLCAALLEAGWQVFAGQYLADWPELPALQQRFPAALNLVPLDVSRMDSIRAAAEVIRQQAGALDVLINNAGVQSETSGAGIRLPQNYDEMHRLYDVNALGALRVVEAFLPLMDAGQGKRLCFISSEAGSIGAAQRTSWFGYCMSKAALNMAVKLLFNDLRPQGYTFRLYHPGWIRSYMHGKKALEAHLEPEEAAALALPHLLGARPDEDRLALIDYEGREWPW